MSTEYRNRHPNRAARIDPSFTPGTVRSRVSVAQQREMEERGKTADEGDGDAAIYTGTFTPPDTVEPPADEPVTEPAAEVEPEAAPEPADDADTSPGGNVPEPVDDDEDDGDVEPDDDDGTAPPTYPTA